MKSPYCSIPGCDRWALSTSPYCMSHLQAQSKEKRMDSQPTVAQRPLKRGSVKKVSDKRAEQNAEYLAEHEPWLKEHDKCEACGDPSEEVHHKNGRFGERLLDQAYWMAVCKVCHREIHANPEWAREQGYLILRSA